MKLPSCFSRSFVGALLFTLLTLMVLPPAQAREDEGAEAAPYLARLTLRGPVLEHGMPEFSLLAGPTVATTLRDIEATLRKAASNPAVSGMIVKLEGVSMGWSQREALRSALHEFRATGKPSYCFLESAGLSAYVLASACSEVSLAPSGGLELPGVTMSKMFYKGLLSKVGIEMQELRMGRYKSAVEGFTRTEPSPPVREETEALLDALYEDVVASLAENLDRKPVEIRALIDHAIFTPVQAKEQGLVHHVEYEDEMLARLQGTGDDRLEVKTAKIGEAKSFDYQGVAGMMQLMNELFSPKKQREPETPSVVVVHATGPIESGGGAPNPLSAGGGSITSKQMVPLLRKLRNDPNVKAVVMRVDSPGGSALASDLIAREVELTAKAKPFVVSMGDLAASGGYYISAPANWIVAENATLTGSIGVIGGIMNTRGAFEMAGVSMQTFSRGKRAEIVSPYGELSDEGRAIFMESMGEIYETFLSIVAKGRKLPKAAVASVAEGRVWTGGQALELGLVDEIGSVDAAIAKAKALASVGEDIEIRHLPKRKSFFEMLSQSVEGEVSMIRAAVRALPVEVRDVVDRVSWIWTLREERVLAVMPDVFEVR